MKQRTTPQTAVGNEDGIDLLHLPSVAHLSAYGLVTTDTEGNILDVNETVLRFLGVSDKTHLVGTCSVSFLHKEDQSRALESLLQQLQDKSEAPSKHKEGDEYRLVLPNGAQCIIKTHVTILRTQDTQVAGALISIQDITTRRHLNAQLRHRIVLEDALGQVSRLLVIAGSPPLEKILQILGSAVKANCAFILRLHKDDNVRVVETVHFRDQERTFPELERQPATLSAIFDWLLSRLGAREDVLTLDRRTLPEEAQALEKYLQRQGVQSLLTVPVSTEGNARLGVMGFGDSQPDREWSAEDIRCLRVVSEMLVGLWSRQLVEEALRLSEERYALVVRAITHGIWDWDIRTGEFCFSPRWRELLGYQECDLSGWLPKWNELTHPDDVERRTAALAAHLEGQTEHYESEYRILHKDGSYRWVFDRGVALQDGTGQPCRMIGSYSDITLRKKTEEEFRIRGRQQAIVAKLGQLALGDCSVQKLMRESVTLVAEGLNIEQCEILKYIPNQNEFVLEVETNGGTRPTERNAESREFCSHALYTLIAEEPVIVDDLTHEERFSKSPLVHTQRAVSCLSVRIGTKDWAFGILRAYSTHKRTFSHDDVYFLQTVANILADTVKRAQTASDLQQSQELFQSFMDNSPIMAYIKDANGRYVYVNRPWERFFRQLLPGRGWFWLTDSDIWPAEHAAQFREYDRIALAQNRFVETVETIQVPNDTYRWLSLRFPLRKPSGQWLIAGISVDITRLVQAEEALRQSEERYALATRGTTDGIWDWNIQTGEVYFSPRWKEILGYQEQELSGWLEEWRKRVHPDDLMQMTAAVTTHLKGQSAHYESEYRILHRNGTYRWVLDRGIASRNAAGQPCRMAGSLTDITARKQAEVALAARVQEASFVATIGTALTQSDSLSSMLRQCTQAIMDYLDAESAYIWALNKNENVLELQTNEEQHGHAKVPPRLSTDQPWDNAFTLASHTSQTIDSLSLDSSSSQSVEQSGFEVLAPYPLLVEQQVVGCLGLVTKHSSPPSTRTGLAAVIDMIAVGIQRRLAETELKTVNENLEHQVAERTTQIEKANSELARRVAELKAANRELESFSYSVSHDLRAPLRHINGFVELLEKRTSTLDDRSKRYLRIISDSARRMGTLIDNLLAFSRMGRAEMKKERLSLTQLIDEVVKELRDEVTDRDLVWDITPLPEVDGDATLLRMVITNLLTNAIKYSQPRTPARIEIGSLPTTEHEVIWFVRDNGVGFDMRYADKLFGVFQRLHRAEEFEGTGIGLATVQRIVQRHGGRIWAEAEIDRGATFFVALPIEESESNHE